MFRVFSIFYLAAACSLLLSCQDTTTNRNSAVNAATSNTTANTPPEFTTTPIPPSANATPGISLNAVNSVPKGTPTPGIPNPKNAVQKLKPGATPTPGIPDPETIRRQMQGLEKPNANGASPGGNMMRPMKKGVRKPIQ